MVLQWALLWVSHGCPSLQDAVHFKHSLVLGETLSTTWYIWDCPNRHSQATPLGFAAKISLPREDNLPSTSCLSHEASLGEGPRSGTGAGYRGAVGLCRPADQDWILCTGPLVLPALVTLHTQQLQHLWWHLQRPRILCEHRGPAPCSIPPL